MQVWSAPGDLPVEIIGSTVVEQIEALFFAVVNLHRPISDQFKVDDDAQQGKKTNERCTREHQTCNKHSDGAPLRSVDKTIPPKNIEVGQAVQMSRVDISSEGVDKVVLDEERVPGINEVDREIVPDLKITIQSKEPLEGTVNRVMEGDGIETVVRSISKEVLVVA